jgi:hypothetical protein
LQAPEKRTAWRHDKQRLVRRVGIVTGAALRLALAALREMFEE